MYLRVFQVLSSGPKPALRACLGRKVEPLGDKPQIVGATAKMLLLLDAEGDVTESAAALTVTCEVRRY